MPTVFSHIVQKRLSQENENVATEALAYILRSSDAVRKGMTKLLRGIAPQLPELRFRTQQTEDNVPALSSAAAIRKTRSRPDMVGSGDDGIPRVQLENKFWANLTSNQPVSYLRNLARCPGPTLLLVVGPEARKATLWRDLIQPLTKDDISLADEAHPGIFRTARTSIGPTLALTSWAKLLSFLEVEAADDKTARNDLSQLLALCEAADSEAFQPISSEQVSDQRTPGFILQLSSVWEAAVDRAVSKEALVLDKLRPQADSLRIGRYAHIGKHRVAGSWLGIHFGLWKHYGDTPLWVVFSGSDWGRADEVRTLLEPWASRRGVFTTNYEDDSFAVALDIICGADEEEVVGAIADRLAEIAGVLSVLQPGPPPPSNV